MRTLTQGLRDFHVSQLHKDLQNHIDNAVAAEPRPPSTNRGGTSQKQAETSEQRVKVDWLTFTSAAEYPALVTSDMSFLQCVWPGAISVHNLHGIKGYPESDTVYLDGRQIGVIGYGAQHGRTMLSMSGTAFQGFTEYQLLHDALYMVDGRITRIDHALDFFNGEITYDEVKDAHAAGEFQLPKAPMASIVGEIGTSRDGLNLGRTFNVGARKSGKMLRAYEKGLEVFAKMPDDFKARNTDPASLVWGTAEGAPNGTIAEKWLRLEVENKNADRELPLDMVTRRDEYFAGAYPFCARVLGLTDGVRPPALMDDAQIDLHRMILAARNSYGNLLFSLRDLGFTADDILQLLVGHKHSEKLVKSGLLSLVKNDDQWKAAMLESAGAPQDLAS